MSVIDQDVLRITANFELGDGSQYQNIYHYIRDGTDPVSDAAHVTLIASFIEDMYDELVGQVTNDVTEQLSFVDRVAFSEITDQWEVVENIGTFTIAFAPANVNDAIPYQSAPYVIFKTDRPKSVGKKFLFPFGEDQQGDTILTGPAIAGMVAFGVEALLTRNLGGDATLAPVITRTAFNTVLRLLVAVVGDVIGSQKRRRPGVGA